MRNRAAQNTPMRRTGAWGCWKKDRQIAGKESRTIFKVAEKGRISFLHPAELTCKKVRIPLSI